MTTDVLTVYGKRIGSLWDRRIGGRYELVEITDTGGTGMWVTLRRVDGAHELAMSVHNLGLNYVCVPVKADPAEDVDRYDEGGLLSGEARVIIPDEPEPVEPSDVRDGDLLTGTLFGLTFEDRACRKSDTGNIWIDEFPPGIVIGGMGDGWRWNSCFTVSSRKPAPTPPLPWVEPDASPYWRHKPSGFIWRLADMRNGRDVPDPEPDDWQGGYFIPADLIERFRQTADLAEAIMRDKALLDAADEVTS